MDRIDSNADGYISTDELKAWIKRVQKRYVYENVAKVWSDYDLNKDNKISWDEYKQATYGYYLGGFNNGWLTAERVVLTKPLKHHDSSDFICKT